MANATPKKSIILFLFALFFSLSAFSQKKLTKFSKEFPTYLLELDGFMTATNNDKLELVYIIQYNLNL